ncbi:MAG: transglutaminase domain-containing protein [Solirubrobacteraceae bacterium]|nr:transglutaminase domain-containing protein [Solirubrobacteraceae bacterium]
MTTMLRPPAPAAYGTPEPPADEPRKLDEHWQTRTAAALILGLAALGIWLPQLGGGVLWVAPVLGFAILVMVRAVKAETPLQSHLLTFAWVVWIPLAVLLGGAGASAISPSALIAGLAGIFRGASGTLSLSSWLAFTGSCWIIGAVQAVRPGRGPAAAGFVLLTLPFVFALAVPHTDDASWYGGAMLGAALLWATRGTLRGAWPAVLAVAVVGTLVSAAIGPTERRIPQRQAPAPSGGAGGIGQSNGSQQQEGNQQGQQGDADQKGGGKPQPLSQTVLDTRQQYDPVEEDGGDVSVDFEVRSPQPALWRMQVLERWDGRGWSTAEQPQRELRQPAARSVPTKITMGALNDRRVISPGRVVSVAGKSPEPGIGESQFFERAPARGTSYDVVSQVVKTDVAAVSRTGLPSPAKYAPETLIWDSLPATIPLPQRISMLPPNVADSGWGDVYKLAWSLSQGEATEMGVVRNVLDYLRNPSNFSYSLKVDKPGPQPLVSFLLDTHVGYCQHFAGAAALLLRLAGIPTRVATGYATGEQKGVDQYVVHSSDPHAWIEVYFPGYGWAPFDPTPGDAAAQVAPSVDPTAPPRRSGHAGFDLRQVAILILGGVALALTVHAVRRWRRRPAASLPLADVIARVVPGPPGPGATLHSFGPDLQRIGPATAALGAAAERERFAPGAPPTARHPRWLLWRAMRRDVGVVHATWLLLVGAPRAEAETGVVDRAQSLRDTASTAPPGT